MRGFFSIGTTTSKLKKKNAGSRPNARFHCNDTNYPSNEGMTSMQNQCNSCLKYEFQALLTRNKLFKAQSFQIRHCIHSIHKPNFDSKYNEAPSIFGKISYMHRKY